MSKQLKEKICFTGNHELCFTNACGYLESSKIVDKQRFTVSADGIGTKFDAAYATLISFACELFLKAIQLKANGKCREGHRFIDLLEDIAHIKEQISIQFDSKSRHMKFEKFIEIHNDAFEEWRYVHEDNPQNKESHLYINEMYLFAVLLKDTYEQL